MQNKRLEKDARNLAPLSRSLRTACGGAGGGVFARVARFQIRAWQSSKDGGANAELSSTPTLVGGNDEPLITYLFKYCKASNTAMLTVQLANVHHFHQGGGSAQLRIRQQRIAILFEGGKENANCESDSSRNRLLLPVA